MLSRHHELDITETEIQGAMDLYMIGREEAVAFLIGEPNEEEKKHPRLKNGSPKKADRMIRTARLARSRWRGKALGFTHVL